MKKDTLITAIFTIQNRALRAEADLKTALELLERQEFITKMARTAIDGAHQVLDSVPAISPRHRSHLALPSRVQKVVNLLGRERRPPHTGWDLCHMSTEALKILVGAHVRVGVPIPQDLAEEATKRGIG